MRQKPLAALAVSATTAMTMLAGCYAGIGHMLEEDYNPRFNVPLPLVQAPAQQPTPQQPQQPQTPTQPPQPEKVQLIRPLNAALTAADTNIGLRVKATDWRWEVKKKDGSPFTNFNVLDGGTFHLYYPASGLTPADCPLELTCTATVDGVQHTSHGYLHYFDDSEEWLKFVQKYYD